MKTPDWRHISHGREIPTENYSDQPFLTHTDDGAWVCTVTTGPGHEGVSGQHVVSVRSDDRGRTWSAPIDVEPSAGPEASYAVLTKVPSGRLYVFYNHNSDNQRAVKADNPPYENGLCMRVDSIGYYVFKFSDDHGRSWSANRYPIDVRAFEIDRNNADRGKVRYFWNVGRPFMHNSALYVSLHKVGGFGEGFFTSSEGVLLRSENILTETDPTKITWATLPDGERGIRSPQGGGPIAEEHSYSVLSDGSFYVVYRTTDGHPAFAYSRDEGHTWSAPDYQKFANGRMMKHPRAANFAWRLQNGKYLYWFHNHGGTWYEDRNPVWLCGGVEQDGPDGKIIAWSQPEIFLYDDDTYVRMSYPDLIEDQSEVWISETQKDQARTHRVPPEFMAALWNRTPADAITRRDLILEFDGTTPIPSSIAAPTLPEFTQRDVSLAYMGQGNLRTGFSIDLSLRIASLNPGQVLLDTRTPTGKGFALIVNEFGSIEIMLQDGHTENHWAVDPGVIRANQCHHLTAIVDAGPHIISFVVDGVLCDGSTSRKYGWGRFSPQLRHVNGSETLAINSAVTSLRIYSRALLTGEAIANHRVLA
jgi:hypothetical protein|uniref:exo-alpha-sialidase n=2 Tax=Cephaloticoccus sp. TaxID=1985742 RepID=UPI0040492236